MTTKLVCAVTAAAFAALVGGDVLTVLTAINMAVAEGFTTPGDGFLIPVLVAALPAGIIAWWAARTAWLIEMRLLQSPDLLETGPSAA
jgi:uncharacterized membrane protein YjjP (DUF1212 family)